MLDPDVRTMVELLDAKLQPEGGVTYAELERRLEAADRTSDARAEARASIEMGTRLSELASVLGAGGQAGVGGMPSADDALGPAIGLLERGLAAALRGGDADAAKVGRSALAKCYGEAGQVREALEQLTQLVDACRMPEDSLHCFEAAQQAGDRHMELEDDASALAWYRRGLDIAREIDDPFEVSVQLGKIAAALSNLNRHSEALRHYREARDLLLRIGAEPELQERITVHRNLFDVAALPRLIAYNDEHAAHARERLGRALLRELPERLAACTQAVATGRAVHSLSSWSVFDELEIAVAAAATLLGELLGSSDETLAAPDPAQDLRSTLGAVGALCRRHFDATVADPQDIVTAARLVVQADRSRRAAEHVRRAEATTAAAGPFGGGTSGHVVYLRSFVAGPRLPRWDVAPWDMVDLEELLACLMDSAPLIALGDSAIEQFGPGRATTTDADWRQVLRALALEAQMLLVIPAPTQGTSWEIEWVTVNKFLHKTCFVMPPPAAGEEAWWRENWAALKEWSVRLGLSLPAYTTDGCVFRLGSEGQYDEIPFSTVFQTDDLRLRLLTELLFRPNLSYDFLYGMQQSLADSPHPSAAGTDRSAASTLRALEEQRRLELSNWDYDSPDVPHAPGVLLLYETPTRLLWAEAVDDLHAALERHVAGTASDFTRRFFHAKVMPILTQQQGEQLLARSLSIESVVSFRVKQMVSYRFRVVPDAEPRRRLVDAVWSGASTCGAPELPRAT